MDERIINAIRGWLNCEVSENSSYIHLLLNADGTNLPEELITYFKDAHKQAQQKYIDKINEFNLDPLNQPPIYTAVLPLKTLQGYLGEVFGGLIAITQRPFNLNWEIPVHLFSFHDTVFDWLDMYLQNAKTSAEIPGRTGDDNLAFVRNENNEITAVLFIEAKCTLTHNSSLINNAHSSLSKGNIFPVSRDKIKQLLIEKGDTESLHFVDAINNIVKTQKNRFDMVSYLYSKKPERKHSWISQHEINSYYKGNRNLVAAELCITDLPKSIAKIYRKGEDSND